MTPNACVTVTIALNNSDLDPEEQDEQVLNLITGLEELDEVDTVGRVLDPNLPEGNKSLGGFVVGLLMAEVSVENFKKLMGFVGDRIGNKPIKLKLKAPDGRELELEASSQAEFEFAFEKAQAFLGAK